MSDESVGGPVDRDVRRLAKTLRGMRLPKGFNSSALHTAADELDRLRAENERLREALRGAAEAIEDWGAYASSYFQERHNLAGTVAKYRAALTPNAN